MQMRQKMAMLVAIMSLALALVSILSIVPRIRLVEAIGLFATAFGAGAGFVDAVTGMRRESAERRSSANPAKLKKRP